MSFLVLFIQTRPTSGNLPVEEKDDDEEEYNCSGLDNEVDKNREDTLQETRSSSPSPSLLTPSDRFKKRPSTGLDSFEENLLSVLKDNRSQQHQSSLMKMKWSF